MKATAHAQSTHASHDVRLTSLKTRPGARDSVLIGGGDATAVAVATTRPEPGSRRRRAKWRLAPHVDPRVFVVCSTSTAHPGSVDVFAQLPPPPRPEVPCVAARVAATFRYRQQRAATRSQSTDRRALTAEGLTSY